jgi:uncharacterized protein (TIGR02145 family)
MKSNLKYYVHSFFFALIFLNISCTKINKDNFDFSKYIESRKDIIDELKWWEADSAYIEFIGFTPNSDYDFYQSDSNSNKLLKSYTKDFFKLYDFNNPIVIVHALRKNTISGNSFDESGISSSDMVDYENGVGRNDAKNLHRSGNYSKTTYRYTSFIGVIRKGKFKMLSYGYEDDRDAIDFVKEIISDKLKKRFYGKNIGLIIVNPKNNYSKIGFYTKGKDKVEIIDFNFCNLLKINPPEIMEKNLAVSIFSNGTPIKEAKTEKEWIEANNNKEAVWCNYMNNPKLGQTNGYIYNWYAVTDERGLAPSGWHILSKAEWSQILELGLDLEYLSSMTRNESGKFYPSKSWWSTQEANSDKGFYYRQPDDWSRETIDSISKSSGFTVICAKNK